MRADGSKVKFTQDKNGVKLVFDKAPEGIDCIVELVTR